jgi:hypothetical protein
MPLARRNAPATGAKEPLWYRADAGKRTASAIMSPAGWGGMAGSLRVRRREEAVRRAVCSWIPMARRLL